MKKIIIFTLTLCFCLQIFACNAQNNIDMQERLIQISNTSSFSDIANEISPAVVGVLSSDVSGESVGSGVCLAKGGYVITNSHVVLNPNNISLYLFDGSSTQASVVYNDPTSDIAILKSKKNLPYLNSSTETLNVGEDILAVGTPLSLTLKHTFTKGIVSAVNRTLNVSALSGDSFMHDLIQHDASLNPGNSGGPLINSKGEVVGINTLKISSGEGIGFAIPIKNFYSILKNYIANNEYQTPYLGVYGYDAEIANYYQKTSLLNGVYVIDIAKNSPLFEANVKNGDVITKFNGKEISNILDLRNELYSLSSNDSAELEIQRNSNTYKVNIPLSNRPLDK